MSSIIKTTLRYIDNEKNAKIVILDETDVSPKVLRHISQILSIENDETDLSKETLKINYANVNPAQTSVWYQSRAYKTSEEEVAVDWANQLHFHLREKLAEIKPDGYSVHIELKPGKETRKDDEIFKEKLRPSFEAWLTENKKIENPAYNTHTGRYIREDVNNAFEAYVGAFKQFKVKELEQSLYDNLNTWQDEEDSVQEEHSQLIKETTDLLKSIHWIDWRSSN